MGSYKRNALESLVKRVFFEHTESLFSNHKVLTVNKIYDYNCSKFMFQCYNNNVYIHFRNKLFKNSVYHNYETRNRNLLRTPFVRLQTFSNSFLTNGIKIWNKLPEKIKILKTIDSFKIMAKCYMLDPTLRESL